jgi:hypothetical protein
VKPTLAISILVELCAQRQLAIEALNLALARHRGAGERPLQASDLSLDDLSDAERERLLRLGQQDLWQLITDHQATHALPPSPSTRSA